MTLLGPCLTPSRFGEAVSCQPRARTRVTYSAWNGTEPIQPGPGGARASTSPTPARGIPTSAWSWTAGLHLLLRPRSPNPGQAPHFYWLLVQAQASHRMRSQLTSLGDLEGRPWLHPGLR